METRGPSRQVEETARPRALAGKVVDLFVARMADLEAGVRRGLDRPASAEGPLGAFLLDAAREAWASASSAAAGLASAGSPAAALARALAAGPVDELGLDAEAIAGLREVVRPLARRWLDLREEASEPLPAEGGVLVLLNRSAWPLPVEAVVLSAFLGDGRLGGRPLAALWDSDELPEFPWVGDFLRRTGVVAATADNAFALLDRGAVVLAFPEGAAAGAKTWEKRYRLAPFDADGILDAALEAGARVVPGALLGSEESYPLLGRLGPWPLTAQFPVLGLAGLLPLPVAWRLSLAPALLPSSSEDPAKLAASVRARIQERLGTLVAGRRSILGG